MKHVLLISKQLLHMSHNDCALLHSCAMLYDYYT